MVRFWVKFGTRAVHVTLLSICVSWKSVQGRAHFALGVSGMYRETARRLVSKERLCKGCVSAALRSAAFAVLFKL